MRAPLTSFILCPYSAPRFLRTSFSTYFYLPHVPTKTLGLFPGMIYRTPTYMDDEGGMERTLETLTETLGILVCNRYTLFIGIVVAIALPGFMKLTAMLETL